MSTLSGNQIVKLVSSGTLLIDPFNSKLVMPASYDLCVGQKILASPLSPDTLGAVIELNENSQSYRVQTGQMVAVLSAERLALPLDICARFGIRSEYTRRGLNAFGGVQIDPGFKGRLIMSLQNVGPEPVTLTLEQPLYTVEFQRLEEPATVGYEGAYQDQDDFPQDQYEFILSARTTSLAEIPRLRQDIARLSVLLEELEERLPELDEGLELKPEVEQRLLHSRESSRDSLISADELRRRLNN